MYIMEEDLKLNKFQFSQRKYLDYESKLYLTRRRIIEWYDFHAGQVYISLSGGLDSTVMYYLIRDTLPGKDIPAVFCNTHLEYPEIVQFIKFLQEKEDNITIITPKKSFAQVTQECGLPMVSKEVSAKVRKLRNGNLSERYRNYLLHGDERGSLGKLSEKWKILLEAPFAVSEKCCDHMKKHPFSAYHKKTGRYPYIGVTQDEGMMRERQYNKTGCNVYDGDRPKSQPIGFWRRQDVLRYVYENKVPISSIYGDVLCSHGVFSNTGEQRTGCMYCCFGIAAEKEPNRFQRMQVSHPAQYRVGMEKLGLRDALKYIGVPYENRDILVS